MRNRFLLAMALLMPFSRCLADPIVFPPGYIPFSKLDYLTRPDSKGYSLIVGETGPGFGELMHYLQSLAPVSGNQQYANRSIELAPGMFFSNVLVPTSSERHGDFRDSGGVLYDPLAGPWVGGQTQFAVNYGLFPGGYQPFVQSIIPMSRMGELFAFRIGPGDPLSAAPEPSYLLLFAISGAALLAARLRQTS